jgi:hypothetical protein
VFGSSDCSCANGRVLNSKALADEAVRIEPISVVEFPDQQGTYSEFLRFWVFPNHPGAENALIYLINLGKFPTQQNRELF